MNYNYKCPKCGTRPNIINENTDQICSFNCLNEKCRVGYVRMWAKSNMKGRKT